MKAPATTAKFQLNKTVVTRFTKPTTAHTGDGVPTLETTSVLTITRITTIFE